MLVSNTEENSAVEAAYALSPMQAGMVFSTIEAGEGAGVYIEQVVCSLDEALDAAAFKVAWERTTARHTALRTRICLHGAGLPRQEVLREVSLAFREDDWRGDSPGLQGERFQSYLDEDRARGFDLESAPMHRIALFQFADTQFRCVWTVHHAIVDGRAMATVIQEVFARYDALRHSAPPPDLPDPVPFQRYIDQIDRAPAPGEEAYWRMSLQGFDEPCHLLLAAPPQTSEPLYRGIGCALSPKLTEALHRAARQAEVTMNTLIQGAWALLIGRYVGREDVLFGATKAVRHLEGIGHDSVGLYINTLPMRVHVREDQPLATWLQELRAQWIGLRDFEQTPLSRAQRWSEVAPGTPLFDTYLVFENGSLDTLIRSGGGEWGGRRFELIERTPAPLTLAVYDGDALKISLEFEAKRVEAPAMERMLGHFETLLNDIAERPGALLGDYEILTETERQHLLNLARPKPLPPGDFKLVPQCFEAVVATWPGKPALQFLDAWMSFDELNRRANRLAHYLRANGVRPESRVGVAIPRSFDTIVAVLGILKSGAAYVPIDPQYPADRVRFMIEDSEIAMLLTVTDVTGIFRDTPVEKVALDAAEARLRNYPDVNPAPLAGPENLAYMIYTSGSTGVPKGVMIQHRSLATFIRASIAEYPVSHQDRFLQFSTLSFDAAVEEIFLSLLTGATLVLRTSTMHLSLSEFMNLIGAWKITVLDFTTAFWHLLCDAVEEYPLPESVRLVLMGGEAALPEKAEKWRRYVGQRAPVFNTYGPTETTVVVTACDLSVPEVDGSVPIGRALAGVGTYVLDSQHRPVPLGVPGELYIGGEQVARGYHRRPDLTASRFLPDPFRPGERMYKTGDRVRFREDGYLVYLGRIDNQVKVRGFRIELGEIEAVIVEHPKVKTAAVITYGVGDVKNQLAAYLVAKEHPEELNKDTLIGDVRDWLRERLPDYMQPQAWQIVDEIPLSPSGKLERRALPPPTVNAPAESPDLESGDDSEIDPRLEALWAEVLGVPQVKPNDNFFALGGHSLLGVVLLAKVEKLLRQRIPPMRLYQAPTLARFAASLNKDSAHQESGALHCIQEGRNLPPLFFVGSTDLLPAILPGLGKDQPLYSLNIFGLQRKDGKLPQMDLEAVARRFIEDLRRIQPAGPYYLGGYCRDAMTALEMARQLHASGESLAGIYIVDMYWEQRNVLTWIERQRRNLISFGPAYLWDKLRRKRRDWHEKRMNAHSRKARTHYAKSGQEVPDSLQNILFIAEYYAAVARYRPLPHQGKITLIMASEWGIKDPAAWRNLATDGVALHEVRAYHQNLWQPPQALALGQKLREVLGAR